MLFLAAVITASGFGRERDTILDGVDMFHNYVVVFVYRSVRGRLNSLTED